MASSAAQISHEAGAPSQGRRAELLLLVVFWAFSFIWLSARGRVIGEIAFNQIAAHRLGVMLFGALLCWLMIYIFEMTAERRFRERALIGLIGATLTSVLQSLFHFVSCRVAPIEGVTPISVQETLDSGMISLALILAWTWMHLALVYYRQAESARLHRPRVAAAVIAAPPVMAAPAAPPAVPKPAPPAAEESFWVSRGRQLVPVRASEIAWVQAQRDYVELHTEHGGGMIRETMAAIQARLDPHTFVRVHRSAIVRRTRIAAIGRKPTGAVVVTLVGGEEVPVGRSYAPGLRALLDQLREQA